MSELPTSGALRAQLEELALTDLRGPSNPRSSCPAGLADSIPDRH